MKRPRRKKEKAKEKEKEHPLLLEVRAMDAIKEILAHPHFTVEARRRIARWVMEIYGRI